MAEQIFVPHIERWWFATRADMPWLTDPDVDDGHPRWPDREQRQWPVIARVIDALARSLAVGNFELDAEEATTAVLPAAVPTIPEDARIVRSWFRESEAPRADPWDDHLGNGRHRLWNVWAVMPDALLPIYSELIAYEDDVPLMGEDFAAIHSESAAEGWRELTLTTIARSPRYADELRSIALRGGYEAPMPTPDVQPEMPADGGPVRRWTRFRLGRARITD